MPTKSITKNIKIDNEEDVHRLIDAVEFSKEKSGMEARSMVSYKHNWRLSNRTTPSGKMLYYCTVCGLHDPAPVKEKYEKRECKSGIYKDKKKGCGDDDN